MGLLHSDEVLHLKIRMPNDLNMAIKIIENFGRLSEDCIEFINLNKNNLEAMKNFLPMIKRCEFIDTKINNFIKCAKQFNVKIYPYKNYEKFIKDIDYDRQKRNLNLSSFIDHIENEILEKEKKIMELVESYEKIKDDLKVEIEKKVVFKKYFEITSNISNINNFIDNKSNNNSFSNNNQANNSLLSLMGIIKATDDLKMNRMILRSSRGNAMVTFFDFQYPENIILPFMRKESTKIEKKIFIIFYPSEGKDYLLRKLLNICDILYASKYNPPNDKENNEILNDLDIVIREKKDYLIQAEGSIQNYLREICGSYNSFAIIDLYRLFFLKEKLIYENLNKCILRDNFIDGEVWVLKKKKNLLIKVLNEGINNESNVGNFIDIYDDENIQKPTYIFSNEFLFPFQQIVNTYGIPKYKEINPAIFNIITFPFLFGVMFGDIGHGLIILFFSLYLILNCNRIKSINSNESNIKKLVKYRYFFLLLSIFSIYCGFIYNEFLSLPFPLFQSCYDLYNPINEEAQRSDNNCVYPLGFDPKWFVSENELTFFNSFKMKFSVIFGILHMILGIILKGINDLNFEDYLAFSFEFVPQLCFMIILFGYLIILIFIKWCKNWSNDTSKAPSIISQLINIFIKNGSVENTPLWGGLIEGTDNYQQERFHRSLFIILIILIPLMLFPKPILEYIRYNKFKNIKNKNIIDNNINNINNDELIDKEENIHSTKMMKENKNEIEIEKSFSDFFINQIIYTMEFILGTVSNTASYLRLWALSLAHAQLSKVFFEKCLQDFIEDGDYVFGFGFVQIFIGFFVYANITLFVLIGMDFMESFLHTLRLHWVEFQNKFYNADGYLFNSFNYKKIFKEKYLGKF